MSGFTDLVPQAQPAIFGEGVTAAGTAGRTWRFQFLDVLDSAGDTIDLTAVTGTCAIFDNIGGTTIATFDFTGSAGGFVLELDEADTANLFSGTGKPRLCYWSLILDDGTDSVQVWGVSNSKFQIYRGD